MFTGIIQKMGTVVSLEISGRGGRLSIECDPWERPYELGESIAVNGVCLSLAEVDGRRLSFDVLQETFDRTHMGGLRPEGRVNLERALRYGDALGGHLVSGHIDGVARVRSIEPVGRDKAVTLSVDACHMPGIVYKGSLACDGISLTVASLGSETVTLHLIPMTLAHTSWGRLRVGDGVNIELDLIGKYAARAVASGEAPGSPKSWKELAGEEPVPPSET